MALPLKVGDTVLRKCWGTETLENIVVGISADGANVSLRAMRCGLSVGRLVTVKVKNIG